MAEKIVIVMDAGATNVRTIAVDEAGELVALHAVPNNTRPDPNDESLRIWDVEEIWSKFMLCAKEVLKKIDRSKIVGVTVTTFGVDGAPMKKDGTLLYPVISWQCSRTIPIMENIAKYIPLLGLYEINGLQPMHFNTITKLIWLKENRPKALDAMDYFVFISSIYLHRLTGEFVTDMSMAGTSMLTDINARDFSERILSALGVDKSVFPKKVEPGDVAGTLTKEASEETGFPAGIPVVASGHDTQFAIYGAGAQENEPVLSSGTWEILMVRSKSYQATEETLGRGVTTEFDVLPGLYNMGVQWIASGALEWFKRMFYGKEANEPEIYDVMISEAKKAGIGSHGVFVHPAFVPRVGPSAPHDTHGSILGLMMNTERGAVYRAFLEALACQAREALDILQDAGGFSAPSLICVGGGSKNNLWNQMRADILGIPVKLVDQAETTVLGAALFTLAGAGVYESADAARDAVQYSGMVYEPSGTRKYDEIYERFKSLAADLHSVYVRRPAKK